MSDPTRLKKKTNSTNNLTYNKDLIYNNLWKVKCAWD